MANAQIEQYKQLHATNSGYGASSAKFIDEISVIINYLRPRTVLDFGCGKGALLAELERHYPHIRFYGYDPAVPGREHIPVNRVDLVINTDVLEHIPEKELPAVTTRIAELSDKVYFNLHHALAKTILPNGDNAHCTVKPAAWYHSLMESKFPHLTALPGRRDYLSVLLTFPLPEEVRREYLTVLERVSRRPWWKRAIRRLTGRSA